MEPLTLALTTAAAIRGLGLVIDGLATHSTTVVAKAFKNWRSERAIEELFRQISIICQVKTIYQPEHRVDLRTFYCPPQLSLQCESKEKPAPFEIHDVGDLPTTQNVVVLGTAGQGKSILFRYLTSQEMTYGKVIPLFVELRLIDRGRTILDHLLEEMRSLGLPREEAVLQALLADGKIALFLDGFDEVPTDRRQALLAEIEHLVRRYRQVRTFVSSRPGHGIEYSGHFDVYDVCYLCPKIGYEPIVRKCAEKTQVDEILAQLNGSSSSIVPVLSTPLMVGLLLVHFKITQQMPENEQAFFGDLFDIVIRRHDRMKGGWERPKKSKLSDSELRQVFEGISFLTRQLGERSCQRNTLNKLITQVASFSDMSPNPDDVLDDIVKLTCLLVEEGSEYTFIHKQVQEFYAAAFIATRNEAIAKKFYAFVPSTEDKWIAELNFLAHMDRYRFNKYYAVPELQQILGVGDGERSIEEMTRRVLTTLSVKPNGNRGVTTRSTMPLVFHAMRQRTVSKIMQCTYRMAIGLPMSQDYIPVLELPNWRDCLPCVRPEVEAMHNLYVRLEAMVKTEEDSLSLFDLS